MLTKSLFRGAFGYLVRSVCGESSAKRDAASETVSEPLGDGAAMNAAAAAASATPDPQRGEAESTDSKQFAPTADVETAPAALAPSLSETAPTSTAALVVDTSASPAVPPPAKVVKVTPTSSRAKTAKSALGIPSGKKRKPKKKAPAPSHPSVGISVDALDKNKLWGPGRIVEVDVEEQRLLITFPGYNKKWNIWTDMLSVAPYGSHAHNVRKNARSWDGRTDLFTGERIAAEDDGGADEVVDRVQTSPHETSPAKPPVRKPKKGYVLELIPDDGVVGANTASPKHPPSREKPRPASASLKRKAVKMEPDTTTTVGPKQKKKARVTKPPPPVVREPYTDADLTRQRVENQETLDKTAAFLTQCAGLWKRQLSAMSDREQKALLGGGPQQGATDANTGSVIVERESTVV